MVADHSLRNSLQKIYDNAFQTMSELMDTRNLYIALFDSATEVISFPLAYESGQAVPETEKIVGEPWSPRNKGQRHGLTEWVIEHKKTLLIPRDFTTWAAKNGLDTFAIGTKCWLGAPMMLRSKVIGVIGLQSFDEEDVFDQTHEELLLTLASQAAVAIENVRLVDALIAAEKEKAEAATERSRAEAEAARVEAESHKHRSNLFHQISDEMAQAGQNPENVLAQVALVTVQAMSYMKCDRVSLFYYDSITSRFTQGLQVFSDGSMQTISVLDSLKQDVQLNRVAAGQTPFYGDDPAAEIRDSYLPLTVFNQHDFSDTLGILDIHFGEPRRLSLGDREILEHLAKQASIAIGYSEARTSAYANEQLAALGQAAATLQHRLSNTINITLPAVMRLRYRVGNDVTAMEILDVIERNTNFATDVIRRMQIPLQKEDFILSDLNGLLHGAIKDCLSGSARFPTVRLATNLQELTTLMSPNPDAPHEVLIKADFADALPDTYISTGRMTEVFRVLIDNGIRAVADADRSGLVLVTSRLKSDVPRPIIEVEVEDTGKGMRDDIKKKIFKQPVPRKQPERGSGLGLWLSNLIVKSHSGYIEITSELGKGSRFRVSLPVLPKAPVSVQEDGKRS